MCQKRQHSISMKFMALMLILSIFPIMANSDSKTCKQLKVAVIDTGLDTLDPRLQSHICPTGHISFLDSDLKDTNGHGTFVVSLIEQYAKDSNYCLEIYKYYDETASGSKNLTREIESIKEAVNNKVDIVNFSGGGEGFNEEEALLIKYSPEVIYVVAAGNEGKNLDIPTNEYYPASYFYPNMEVIGAVDSQGKRVSSSNYGKKVENKELGENVRGFLPDGKTGYMTGTSMATAIFTGKLIKKTFDACNGTKK